MGWSQESFCAFLAQLNVESTNEIRDIPEDTLKNDVPENTLEKLSVSVVYVCDPVEAAAAISRLLARSNALGVDIETYGLPPFQDDKLAGLDPRKSGIRLIQFYDGDHTVYVFDILKLGGFACLGALIWECPMIAHNAMFEMKHLLHKGVYPKRLGCTLLCDRVINGNRRELREDLGLSKDAGLKDLSKELLGLDISKEQQTSDWSCEILSQEQIEYAGLDAVLALKIFEIQLGLLNEGGLVRAYQILRNAQYPIAKMELCGIGFDVAKHKQAIASWHKESERLHDLIMASIGTPINLNSSKQVGEWLQAVLKPSDLEAWPKTPKGQLKTSVHEFKSNERVHDIFPFIVGYKFLAKRISSFGENMYSFIDESANRLYGSFSLGTTATGRMASNKPNMQNIPRSDFRHLFCARDGYTLIGLDYSQQELRVAALIAEDHELLRVYEEGEDAHITTAAMVLGLPKEQVTKEHRQLAKALNFGLLYGQGAKGLAEYAKRNYGVALSEEEAQRHRNKFFRVYKGLRGWQKDTGYTDKIKTPCGRIRDFSREKTGYLYTAALNHPVQGAAAEITLIAIAGLTPLLCDDCLLVNVIHDEILLEVREDLAPIYAEKVEAVMEQAFLSVFPGSGPYLNGLVDAKFGKTWADTK